MSERTAMTPFSQGRTLTELTVGLIHPHRIHVGIAWMGGAQRIGNPQQVLDPFHNTAIIGEWRALTVLAYRPGARAVGQGKDGHLTLGTHAPVIKQPDNTLGQGHAIFV